MVSIQKENTTSAAQPTQAMIPFNRPFLSGNELAYIQDAIGKGKISGDGYYTAQCHRFFEGRYGFAKTLLTTSCTDALEMAAILLNIQPGDEVIAPSYTFVSTVNAFVLRGARIVFVDSEASNPNMDVALIEPLITPKTKAIVCVHYAGVACDMDALMALANKHGIKVVEDAAQAIESFYKGKPLGSFGHFAAFSFHETKNIIAGEGGLLVLNDTANFTRAEIIREKGTNRSQFFRGEVDKYGWVDMGSSFLPSDLVAAFLFAQLENLEQIQEQRKALWMQYYRLLEPLAAAGLIRLPFVPDYASNNGHMFYIVVDSLETRSKLIACLKAEQIHAVFHYQSLHKSEYYTRNFGAAPELVWSDLYTDRLLRLPLFYELTTAEVKRIADIITNFYAS